MPFNIEKIANAIFKAAQAAGGHDYDTSLKLDWKCDHFFKWKFKDNTPEVEDIQDMVERYL